MEALISEREGMIADNKQSEQCGTTIKYGIDNFLANAKQLTDLVERWRNQ
jgi:hypothetical protein